MSGSSPPSIDINALGAWLTHHVEGFKGPFRLIPLAGGQSNPTYRLEAASGAYALRRRPFGPLLPSAHAVDREFRLLTALHPAGFAVPAPLALCMDDKVIGAAFYLMEFKEGRSFRNGQLPGVAPADRRAAYLDMVDSLAELHRLDFEALGLGDYGRPGNYMARQVARWTRQYRAAQTDDLPVVDRLIEYLGATIPDQSAATIIHGDYRVDNIILDSQRPKIVGVIDWELSTIGDPLADFAYFAMNWRMPAGERAGLMGVDFEASGIPTLEQISDRYCAAAGRSSLPDLDWYFAYNQFRMVGIVQGVKKRLMDGNAAGDDAAISAARVIPLAESAWAHALRAGAQ